MCVCVCVCVCACAPAVHACSDCGRYRSRSLGVEPVDHDVMRQPPRPSSEQIVTRTLLVRVITSAVVIVIGTLYMFSRDMGEDGFSRHDTTLTFTTFVMFDMFNALACRSATKSLFSIGAVRRGRGAAPAPCCVCA